jgi:hypothetical protein
MLPEPSPVKVVEPVLLFNRPTTVSKFESLTNSTALADEFTFTNLPAFPVKEDGVSLRPRIVETPPGVSTNSTALPSEFTFKNLLAVKDGGVSVSSKNVEDPLGVSTSSTALPSEFTFKNLLAVKLAGVSESPKNVEEPGDPLAPKLTLTTELAGDETFTLGVSLTVTFMVSGPLFTTLIVDIMQRRLH